jgi:dUTP pyrophosphatase
MASAGGSPKRPRTEDVNVSVNADVTESKEVKAPKTESSNAKLKVKRLVPHAILPLKAIVGDAGYDLCSIDRVVVPARGKAIVGTGLAITTPEGTYGRVAPRSGFTWKKHTDIGAGVIDRSYTGEVGVIVFNHGETDLVIQAKDAIAQLILEKIQEADVEEVDKLEVTVRGSDGYGSTDLKRV